MPDPLTLRTEAEVWLAIATGHHLSLALGAGGAVLAEDHRPLARGHAEALVPALAALLAGQPRPARVLVETGPGSFTGLRIGIAAARALGLAWGVPTEGVSSMLLVAAAARAAGTESAAGTAGAAGGAGSAGRDDPLMVALAAPRGQLWIQSFDGLEAQGPPRALPLVQARALLLDTPRRVTGSGLRLLGLDPAEDVPRAADCRLVEARHFGPPLPAYVREEGPAVGKEAA